MSLVFFLKAVALVKLYLLLSLGLTAPPEVNRAKNTNTIKYKTENNLTD